MSGRLQGQVALVTGASSGFGEFIAEGLAAEGAKVALVARSKDKLEALKARIDKSGGTAIALTADVTAPADVKRTVEETRKAFGPITLLVNNAGIPGPFAPIGEVDVEEWWKAQTIHVKAPMMYMSAVMSDMRARKQGRIVNVASMGAKLVRYAMSAYGVGKRAEVALTEHAALEGKDDNVFAFAIHPGLAMTALADSTLNDPGAQKWAPKMIETVKHRMETVDSEAGFKRCTEMCVDLASGDYDVLTGGFLFPEDDFAKLKAEALKKG